MKSNIVTYITCTLLPEEMMASSALGSTVTSFSFPLISLMDTAAAAARDAVEGEGEGKGECERSSWGCS